MSKRLTYIFLILVLLTTSSTSGYANTIDSLKSLLGDENDTSNLGIYKELGIIYGEINLDSSLFFNQLGLKQATSQDDKRYISQFNNNIGAYYFYKGYHNLALQYFNLSYALDSVLSDTNHMIITLNNIGRMYQLKSNYEAASKILYKAMNIAEKKKNIKMLNTITGNLGLLYADQGELELALIFFKSVISLTPNLEYPKTIADNYLRIGTIFRTKEIFDSAQFYYDLALQNYLVINNQIGLANIYLELGQVYIELGEHEKAIELFNKTNKINKEIGADYGFESTYNYLGNYYQKIGDTEKALKNYHLYVEAFEKRKIPTDISEGYKSLSYFHKTQHNYDSALHYYELYTIQKDSIFTLEKSQQIAELETIYQTEKKEKEILQLAKEKEQKQNQILLLSGFVGLLVILIVFTYIYYKTRQKSLVLKAITTEQKKQFKAVLGAQENERKRIAAELHDSVGPLLSVSQLYISELGESGNQPETESKQLCNKSLNALKEATQEIRDISHNLMPGVLVRIGLGAACRELIRKINETKNHTISFELIGYNKRLDETIELTFYRIFQELLNNILKHSKADKVEVNLLQKNSTLSLTVKDNGIGFNTKNMDKAKGIGLQSIYSRISLIGGEVEIDSSEKGTITIVTVPL